MSCHKIQLVVAHRGNGLKILSQRHINSATAVNSWGLSYDLVWKWRTSSLGLQGLDWDLRLCGPRDQVALKHLALVRVCGFCLFWFVCLLLLISCSCILIMYRHTFSYRCDFICILVLLWTWKMSFPNEVLFSLSTTLVDIILFICRQRTFAFLRSIWISGGRGEGETFCKRICLFSRVNWSVSSFRLWNKTNTFPMLCLLKSDTSYSTIKRFLTLVS